MKQLMLFIFFVSNCLIAQDTYTLSGTFPNFPKSKLELKGFDGLQSNVLSTYNSKEDGKFTLSYPAEYVGVAHLYMNGSYLNLFFLNKENITIYWEDLTNRDAMQISGSQEYETFLKGMKTFQETEAKLAGLNYLLPLYENDSLKQKWILNELQEVVERFPNYVSSLPEELWVRHYLHSRGLIEQMPKTVETYNWRAPRHIPEFMAIDFKQLIHAGLYKDLIEGYTYLVERFPLEETSPLFEKAIDKVIDELKDEPSIQEDITLYWFELLESLSQNQAAEYLASEMLNQKGRELSDKSTAIFEQYLTMTLGQIAPDIVLNQKSLKNLKNKYKFVIFGASWCPGCQSDYSKLKEMYETLKQNYDLEMVYISVDTDQADFEEYYKNTPFITFFDGKGWETPAAKAYHVSATPAYFLLDTDLKILAKIKSPEHLSFWLKNN
jgi:thiol-disulfide isomerase/thioredoxin